ncbi:hypothetical protein [Rubrolithibacter danxiaensis]|uniref:hypothetical protein n=1 Tax=Rubrolithibacter danxiaensis TaxID=3390805 RepID=UPI003BF83DA6
MKKEQSATMKLTEKFDKELFHILSHDLAKVKKSKNSFIVNLPENPDKSLLVA